MLPAVSRGFAEPEGRGLVPLGTRKQKSSWCPEENVSRHRRSVAYAHAGHYFCIAPGSGAEPCLYRSGPHFPAGRLPVPGRVRLHRGCLRGRACCPSNGLDAAMNRPQINPDLAHGSWLTVRSRDRFWYGEPTSCKPGVYALRGSTKKAQVRARFRWSFWQEQLSTRRPRDDLGGVRAEGTVNRAQSASSRTSTPLKGRTTYVRRPQTKASLRSTCPVCRSLPNEPCRSVGAPVKGGTRRRARYIDGDLRLIGGVLPQVHADRKGV